MGSLQTYERGLVVHHPGVNVRRYRRTWRQVNHLVVEHGLDVTSHRTSESRQDTIEAIARALRPTDLVIVVGGDGTLNMVVSALYKDPDKAKPDILTTNAGSAADCNRSLNGRHIGERALAHVLQHGQLTKIHPLRLQIGSEEPAVHYGVNNAGLNFTAKFAKLLNSDGRRHSRLRAIPMLQNAGTFRASLRDRRLMEIRHIESDTLDAVLDWSAVHSHKAARYGLYDISHTDDEFLVLTQLEASAAAVALASLRMMTGNLPSERKSYVAFKTGDQPTVGHVDGEVFDVPPESLVAVDLAPEPFAAWSTYANYPDRLL